MINSNDDFALASSTNASGHVSTETNFYQNYAQEGSHDSHRTSTALLPAAKLEAVNRTACPSNLLNFYCSDLQRRQHQLSKSPNSAYVQPQHQDPLLDESLRVIDFLFDNPARVAHYPTSSSFTEGAVQIIDQFFLNCGSMNTPFDSMPNMATNTGSCNKKRREAHCIDTISRMESPAGRSLYLVSKGAKSGKKRCVGSPNATQQDTSSHYLCLLSSETSISDTSLSRFAPHLSFCSCRSFLERTRTTISNGRLSCDRSMTLCKHLLAIKLLPVFGAASEHPNALYSIPTMEFASEEDFSRAVTQRLSI